MATIRKTIKPAGGGDYTNLTDALNGITAGTDDYIFDCFAGDCSGPGGDTIMDAFVAAFHTLTINASTRHNGIQLANPSTVAYFSQSIDVSTFRPVTIQGMVHGNVTTVFAASTFTIKQAVFQDDNAIGFGFIAVNFDQNGAMSTRLENCAMYGVGTRCLCAVGAGSASTVLTMLNVSCNETVTAEPNAIPGASTYAIVNATNCVSFGSTGADGFDELPQGGGGHEVALINLTNCCYATKSTSGTNTAAQVSNLAAEFVSSTNFNSLNSSSKIRNNGTNDGLSTDIIGTARPQGAAYDIGAFEFLAASASGLGIPLIGFIGYGG